MDTREVSLVDRAANKWEFLVVKRDNEEATVGASATADKKTQAQAATPTTKVELPASAFAYVGKADDRTTWTLPLFDGAEAHVPSIVLTDYAARVLQAKVLAVIPEDARPAVTRKVALAWLKARPTATTLDLPEHLKKSWKGGRVGDALERIRSIKAALAFAPSAEGSAPLPKAIGMGVRSVQFYLQQLAVSKQDCSPYLRYYPDENELTAASLASVSSTAKKGMGAVLDEVEARLVKLMGGLEEVSMFDTEQAKSLTGAADLLGQALVEHPTETAKALDLAGKDRDSIAAAILKSIRELEEQHLAVLTGTAKADEVAGAFEVGSRLHRSAAALEDAVCAVLTGKAAPEGVTRDADSIVEDVRATMQYAKGVGGDDLKARLARTIKTLGEIAARWTPKTPSQEAPVATTTTEKSSPAAPAATTTAPAPALTPTAKVETPPPAPTPEPAAEVAKAGRKIKKERLDRLKSAVTTLKEALSDLRAGNSNMTKFKNASSALAALIAELDVAKSVNGRRGISQPGEVNPGKPNLGSGVQPDTSTVSDYTALIGDGTPSELGDILKGLQRDLASLKGTIAQRDATIEGLTDQVERLTKRRIGRAPSGGSGDERPPARKSPGAADDVSWPTDMNDPRFNRT